MSQLPISSRYFYSLSIAIFFLATPLFHASALTISPARLEINGDPGQVISGEFILINEQDEAKVFYSSAQNFEAQGETGTPNFVDAKDGLATWISVPEQITLEKGEQKKIPFSISIPAGVEAGGHFAAIFLSTASPYGGSSQVSVGAKIGILILLRVSGQIKEGGGITSFSTINDSVFFSSLPIGFTYRFSNTGSDRARPEGSLHIKNMLAFIAGSTSANPSSGNVLPGSTRRFEVMWGDARPSHGFFSTAAYQFSNFFFGWYRASLDLSAGNTSGIVSETLNFFIFPWQLILIVCVVFVIFFWGMRRYNQWIIKRAQLGR